mmetsp:Transcript_12470/g.20704  ORF Transcript_12470/g.20704 Transcript_12470/m.20704 type:complete len:250 (+) Transcript_12470:139-888(+)|eukprot:CAMPEP_0119012832 /NCGR_PEP_ID=MMETSP1176-20130426/7648_1 /TAXON_ID=265551 /ORGANISM="Synedropsis recta cf, Strain CCMP1620" /LENGTH=249 /DNA_ID=CAMNT_0006965865 /DNA_START=45 /DNA_END=794 /DNA_ORIENTATION=+
MTMTHVRLAVVSVLTALIAVSVNGFVSPSIGSTCRQQVQLRAAVPNEQMSRQDWLKTVVGGMAVGVVSLSTSPAVAADAATDRKTLDQCLYSIMRVREATFQESRLINSGKFKDMQRANVKLAVKFILNNYRLSDTFIAASAYIEETNRRIGAGEVGQAAVQDLQTILEYFDSSDVQNLKVGAGDNMSGKERLVLQGLDSTRKNIDGFLAYFPAEMVQAARKQILDENALNVKEWDPILGDIVNLPPAI